MQSGALIMSTYKQIILIIILLFAAQSTQAAGRFFWLFKISPGYQLTAYSLIKATRPNGDRSNRLLFELSSVQGQQYPENDDPDKRRCRNWDMNYLAFSPWKYRDLSQPAIPQQGLPVIAAPGTLEQSVAQNHILDPVIPSSDLGDQGVSFGSLEVGAAHNGYLSSIPQVAQGEISYVFNCVDAVPFSTDLSNLLSSLTNAGSRSFFNPGWGIYINSIPGGEYWALVPHFVVLLLRLIPNGMCSDSLHLNPDRWGGAGN